MEKLVTDILSDKTILILVLLILSLIIYFILKRLMKLIIIAIIMLTLFTGYMYYRGEKMPTALMELIDDGKKAKDTVNRLGDTINTMKETGRENVQSAGSGRGSSSE